jgi:hypothetical protein
MNRDIIYEVLKCFYYFPHENGGALLAKKVLISIKSNIELFAIIEKMEKPIVFSAISVLDELVSFLENSESNTVFWDYKYINGTDVCHSVVSVFDKKVKLFGEVEDVHSIGDMIYLVFIVI